MAGSINKVTLLGHLGRDPEVRTTQDLKEIVNLSQRRNRGRTRPLRTKGKN